MDYYELYIFTFTNIPLPLSVNHISWIYRNFLKSHNCVLINLSSAIAFFIDCFFISFSFLNGKRRYNRLNIAKSEYRNLDGGIDMKCTILINRTAKQIFTRIVESVIGPQRWNSCLRETIEFHNSFPNRNRLILIRISLSPLSSFRRFDPREFPIIEK